MGSRTYTGPALVADRRNLVLAKYSNMLDVLHNVVAVREV